MLIFQKTGVFWVFGGLRGFEERERTEVGGVPGVREEKCAMEASRRERRSGGEASKASPAQGVEGGRE